MLQQRTPLQLCPTRIDGQPQLFAHKVTRSQCQDRQRGRYHKCFTCVHNNAYVEKNGVAETGSSRSADKVGKLSARAS